MMEQLHPGKQNEKNLTRQTAILTAGHQKLKKPHQGGGLQATDMLMPRGYFLRPMSICRVNKDSYLKVGAMFQFINMDS
jgi:hypothetical protein